MNIPGIKSIKTTQVTETLPVLIKPGDSFLLSSLTTLDLTEIPFIQDTCGLKVDHKTVSNGNIYQYVVSFTIAGHDKDTITLLENLSLTNNMFILEDKSKTKYIIGVVDQSFANLNFKLKNDASAKGGRSIQVTIKGEATVFPLYLQ